MANSIQTNPITETQYSNKLNDIEAQIITKRDPVISDACYAKCCLSITFSLLLCPFAICDVYFASTDDSCITQSQSDHNLNITLQSYLLSSGIIVFIFIGILNFSIFIFDLNMTKSKQDNDNEQVLHMVLNLSNILVRTFGLCWLILGCVLFWAYTTISNCSQSVTNYLFARFIIFIIGTFFSIKLNSE